MRPLGEVSQALLDACRRLATNERGATLRELSEVSCVGLQVARDTVTNLKRHGHLRIVAVRRVTYRNRPVSEYAPSLVEAPESSPGAELGRCLSMWNRM